MVPPKKYKLWRRMFGSESVLFWYFYERIEIVLRDSCGHPRGYAWCLGVEVWVGERGLAAVWTECLHLLWERLCAVVLGARSGAARASTIESQEWGCGKCDAAGRPFPFKVVFFTWEMQGLEILGVHLSVEKICYECVNKDPLFLVSFWFRHLYISFVCLNKMFGNGKIMQLI